jgi:hypothetical protein
MGRARSQIVPRSRSCRQKAYRDRLKQGFSTAKRRVALIFASALRCPLSRDRVLGFSLACDLVKHVAD